MEARLRILHGKLRSDGGAQGLDHVPLTRHRLVIGSDDACQIVCKSRRVSARHCMIIVEPDHIVVVDLGSEFGTFVNELLIETRQPLRHQDRLRVGRLEFELDAPSLAIVEPSESEVALPNPDTVVGAMDTTVEAPSVDLLVAEFLSDADQADRIRRHDDPATRFFQTKPAESSPAAQETAPVKRLPARPERKPPSRLPPPPPITGPDSVAAAESAVEAMLKGAKHVPKHPRK